LGIEERFLRSVWLRPLLTAADRKSGGTGVSGLLAFSDVVFDGRAYAPDDLGWVSGAVVLVLVVVVVLLRARLRVGPLGRSARCRADSSPCGVRARSLCTQQHHG
jgi:hypothetical protein